MARRRFHRRCWWITCGFTRTEAGLNPAERAVPNGNLPLWLQIGTVETPIGAVRCNPSCAAPGAVIKPNHSVLPPKGKPEFHAEWLRDEPCDATTTCPRKTGVWCQLLPGDGEHEIRGSLQQSLQKQLAWYFESFHVRSFWSQSRARNS